MISDRIFVVTMQNEGLHTEIKEKVDLLETQIEKNKNLEKENKNLQKMVEEMSMSFSSQLLQKENEVDNLKKELEMLRSQVSGISSTAVSVTSENSAPRKECMDHSLKASDNIFDQI